MDSRPHPSILRQALPIVLLTGAGGAFLAALDPPSVINVEDQAPLAQLDPGSSADASAATAATAATAAAATTPPAPLTTSTPAEPGSAVTPTLSSATAESSPAVTNPSNEPIAPPSSDPAVNASAEPAPSTLEIPIAPETTAPIPSAVLDPAVSSSAQPGAGAIEAPVVPASTVPGTPACNPEAVAGPIVRTRWGPVQVEVHVAADGITLCEVDAPITPTDHRKSIRINEQAVPRLNEAALRVQGIDFDLVSGATITTNAYKLSLQAIIDGLAAG